MNKVSIIIPFYVGINWLEESLESIFNQTYKDFEVILVNDGSKEDFKSLLERYKGRVSFYSQENQGPAAARNLGISKASGEYIAFEDSDDIWLPEKLEKQVRFMEERNLIWSHTGFYYWWPETGITKEIDVSHEYGNIYFQRYIASKIATPCVMIRRDYLLNSGLRFPEHLRNGEDGSLWKKISKENPIGLIQKPLAKIRMRGGNSYTHAIERFRLEAASYEEIKNNNMNLPKGILRIKYVYYIYARLFKGEVTPCKEFFAKCLWVLPYYIERLYVKKLVRLSNKDEKYIIRNNTD